ncbi:hypothetical protein EDC94DRAFT_654405 [Helicostylum pulchrum]|nr:hypothetical protein EDC94DRAFT_654405 [Helicostylum pulchrum]
MSNSKNISDKKKLKQPALSSFFSARSSSNTSNDIITSPSSPTTVPVNIAPNKSLTSSVPAIDLSSATSSSTEESLFVPIDDDGDEEADSGTIDDYAFHDVKFLLYLDPIICFVYLNSNGCFVAGKCLCYMAGVAVFLSCYFTV